MAAVDPFRIWSAQKMLRAYATKDVSPVEVLQAHLNRAHKVNPAINALFSIRAEAALELARQSERRWLAPPPLRRD